jgi:hypothetical protein
MHPDKYRTIAGFFTLYCFFLSLVVAMLFVTGNLQSFMETTNRLLMEILEWVLYIFLIADLYYMFFFFLVFLSKRKKKNKYETGGIFGIVWAGAGFLYGGVFLVLINFIFAWL